MSRRSARQSLVALMYEYDINGEPGDKTIEVMADILDNELKDKDKLYIEDTMKLFLENIEKIDDTIKASLKSWNFERIARTDVSVLRLAVLEMLYYDNIPNKVSINEAVELAKIYCSEKSPKFINGVLAGCLKKISQE